MTGETSRAEVLSAMSPLELVRTGEKLQRYGQSIKLDRVITDVSAVDESHAQDLTESIQFGGRGQTSPITVRAREEDNDVVYDVIDGFHRASGMQAAGIDLVRAEVLFGCDDEELFDQRILAASSVKSVQFTRIATWVNSSFNQTAWAKKGLTATQALAIAVNDSKTSRHGLNTEEVQSLKEWVDKKCSHWGRKLHDTYRILRIVDRSNPELVKVVRQSGGGKDRQARVTPERLAAVAISLPGPDFFDAQVAIMDYVLEKRLYATETKELVYQIAPHIDPGMSKEEVSDVIERTMRKLTIAQTDERKFNVEELDDSSDDFDIAGELADALRTDDNVSLNRDLDLLDSQTDTDNERSSVSTIDHKSPEHNRTVLAGISAKHKSNRESLRKRSSQSLAADRFLDAEALAERVHDLQNALKTAREETESTPFRFWNIAEYLTPLERSVMKRIFELFDTPDQAARNLKITEAQLFSLVKSSFVKHSLIMKGQLN